MAATSEAICRAIESAVCLAIHRQDSKALCKVRSVRALDGRTLMPQGSESWTVPQRFSVTWTTHRNGDQVDDDWGLYDVAHTSPDVVATRAPAAEEAAWLKS